MCNRFIESFADKVIEELEKSKPCKYYILRDSNFIIDSFTCKKEEIPEYLYNSIMNDFREYIRPDGKGNNFLFKLLKTIKDILTEEMNDLLNLGLRNISKSDKKLFKQVFKQIGLILLKEIHEKEGLLTCINNFEDYNLIEDPTSIIEKLRIMFSPGLEEE